MSVVLTLTVMAFGCGLSLLAIAIGLLVVILRKQKTPSHSLDWKRLRLLQQYEEASRLAEEYNLVHFSSGERVLPEEFLAEFFLKMEDANRRQRIRQYIQMDDRRSSAD